MIEKSTSTLENILKNTSMKDYKNFIENEIGDTYDSLSDYLLDYIGKHGLKQAELVRKSCLNRSTGHNIFNGNRKNPKRDYIIAICLACEMSFEETNRALRFTNAGTLYVKESSDIIIIFCINNKIFDVMKVNELLAENGFPPLAGTCER